VKAVHNNMPVRVPRNKNLVSPTLVSGSGASEPSILKRCGGLCPLQTNFHTVAAVPETLGMPTDPVWHRYCINYKRDRDLRGLPYADENARRDTHGC
jgi:hypothetical protein